MATPFIQAPLNLSGNNPALTNPAFIAKSVFDSSKARNAVPPQVDYQSQFNAVMSQLRAAQQPVYAPKLDYATINAQARSAAENAVNPLYTRRLNEFLAEQGAKRTRQQQQYETGVKRLEEDLTGALDASNTQRGRTSEDVALAQGQSREEEDQFQTDSGTQFEEQRLAQARQQAGAGTLGTGAGQRQTGQATQAQNTQEQRQTQEFEQNRAAQELFKSRTFEDLLKTDELSKLKTTRGKETAKFELDAYLQDLEFETSRTRQQLEEDRVKSVLSNEAAQKSSLVFNFINSIGNPAQRNAAFQAYGGLL